MYSIILQQRNFEWLKKNTRKGIQQKLSAMFASHADRQLAINNYQTGN